MPKKKKTISCSLVSHKIKFVRVRRDEFVLRVNRVEFKNNPLYLAHLIEQLTECDYGFDTGLINLSQEDETFLLKSKLGKKASKGDIFPTTLCFDVVENLVSKLEKIDKKWRKNNA